MRFVRLDPAVRHISDRIGRRKMYLIVPRLRTIRFLYFGMLDTAVPSAVSSPRVVAHPARHDVWTAAAFIAEAFTPGSIQRLVVGFISSASITPAARAIDRDRAVPPPTTTGYAIAIYLRYAP